VPFETATREHILQSFLGAKWTDSTLVCDDVQADFGRTIDVALERGIQPVRNLVGSPGGRGGTGPTVRHTFAASGEPVELEPGGRPRLVRPRVHVEPHPSGEGHDIRLEAANKDQLEWAIAKLREKLPPGALSPAVIQQIHERAETTRGRLREAVHIRLLFGGADYFRGLVKSCFNLLATHVNVHDPSFDPVRAFVLTGQGDSSSFARWPGLAADPPLPTIGSFDQFIGIVSRGSSIEAVVRLFGTVLHSVRLADTFSGAPIHCGYLVDPTRDAKPSELRDPQFSATAIPVFLDQPPKPGPPCWETATRSLNAFGQRYFEREMERLVRELIAEVLEPQDGLRLSAEMLQEVARRVAEVVAEQITGASRI
jgi:hypothetical protein